MTEITTNSRQGDAPPGDGDVQQAILDAHAGGRTVVLATIVRTRGSVPRHAGSKMLIDPERGLVGTIGGGCGEADVLVAARDVMASLLPQMVTVELVVDIASWSPAVCGGIMEVFLEPVPARK